MSLKGCSFIIFKYMDKYVFFVGMEMYITIVKGYKNAFYPEPALILSANDDKNEIKEAIVKCVKIAKEKENDIKEFNDMLKVGAIYDIMIKNFKTIGIKEPISIIRKNTKELYIVPDGNKISLIYSSDIPARGNPKMWRDRELDIDISLDEFAEKIWKEFNYYKGNDYTNLDEK